MSLFCPGKGRDRLRSFFVQGRLHCMGPEFGSAIIVALVGIGSGKISKLACFRGGGCSLRSFLGPFQGQSLALRCGRAFLGFSDGFYDGIVKGVQA